MKTKPSQNQLGQISRQKAAPDQGLTQVQVEERRRAGLDNRPAESLSKTTGQIIRDNVCTFFNFLF